MKNKNMKYKVRKVFLILLRRNKSKDFKRDERRINLHKQNPE